MRFLSSVIEGLDADGELHLFYEHYRKDGTDWIEVDIEKARKKILNAGLPNYLGDRLKEGV